MTLTLITDCRRACPDARTDRALVHEVVSWLEEAVAAGIDVIQIREPAAPARLLRDVTCAAVAATRGTSTRVLVSDRADVALVAGADGVHLRDDGWPAERVRALSASWVIGRSVHAPGPWPASATVDYVTFGAVFGSGGKPPRGVEALRAVVASSDMPVVAVGGVTVENAPACVAAGAAGVAAISLFLPPRRAPGALGPRAAIESLRAAGRFSYTVRTSEYPTSS
jgi:thiamine-phosphate pyrophosphorylase